MKKNYTRYSKPVDEVETEKPVIEEEDTLVESAVEPSIADAEIPEEVMETVIEHVEEDHHDDFLTGEPLQVSTPVPESNMVKCTPSCDLNFRFAPQSDGAIIMVLHPTDVIEVDWTDTEWVAAKTADGTEGFVMKKFLDRV